MSVVNHKRTNVIEFNSTNAAVENVVPGNFIIEAVRWVGASNASHTAILTDSVGDYIFYGDAQTTDHTENLYFNQGKAVQGLKCLTLGSGTLYVYLR